MNAFGGSGTFPAPSLLAQQVSVLFDTVELAGEASTSILKKALRGSGSLSLFFLEDAGLCVSLKGSNFFSLVTQG